jgi:protein gp37
VSAGTSIQWTDATWNPVRGCTKVSAGCKHCYAERFAERFRGVPGHPFEQGFDVRLVPEALDLPARWKKPRRVFVNSMSDLFHEAVPFDFIDRVFAVMARERRHTFQVLTKRAARMRQWCEERGRGWSLVPNIWLGVSVEDRTAAFDRVPHLIETPAAVRFLSCEPLLGPIDLSPWLIADRGERGRSRLGLLHWVIVGGESGPGARPMRIPWASYVVAQCRSAGVPVFVKQIGAVAAREAMSADKKGGDMTLWPPSLRVREFPEVQP